MDIILKARGLAKRQVGNVLLVAPTQEIAQQEQDELKAQNQLRALSPLHSEFIQVNYAKAADISSLIRSTGENAQSMLSARGFMSVDTRTNTLWLRDTSSNIKEVRKLINKLDVPVRQVLIEARVVNVDKTFLHDLGIRFGVTRPNSNTTGTLAGANAIAAGGDLSAIDTLSRLNVNLPAGGATSGIGLALADLGRGYLLDLELSAMEEEGKGNLVSTPRIITGNEHQATIKDGEEIPYQQVSSSGATAVAFKEAVLSIQVTPQITPDNKIILTLQVNQDKVSTRDIMGIPAIDTQEVSTQVLVDNGGTIVLGGIYRQEKRKTFRRVPFFGSIPIFGHFFRQQNINNTERELLVFITPKVITQAVFHEA
jgi:type IV pilus assembly protein PilQ